MSLSERKTIEFDQGWDIMQKGITKLIGILEELPEQQVEQQYMSSFISSGEYWMHYTTIYVMCTQKPPHNYSQQLYDKYREVFEDYITSMVLPALREKHDEFMLRELVKRWIEHKVMVRWISRCFCYLQYNFVVRRSLTGLLEVGLACFRDLIYKEEINGKVKDAVISLIDQDCKGEQIDLALLKNIFDIYVEIGMDFEPASYYAQKKNLIIENSYPDCMLKKVQHQLASQLLEKQHSGCHALLRDDKHVTSEGTSLVKQAEDATSNKKVEKKVVVGLQEQGFVRKVNEMQGSFVGKLIKLEAKYWANENDYFVSDPLSFLTPQEAFEAFYNKVFAGSPSAEQMDTFFYNICTKDGSEKLSDEEIEETLEKVATLHACIRDEDFFEEFYRMTYKADEVCPNKRPKIDCQRTFVLAFSSAEEKILGNIVIEFERRNLKVEDMQLMGVGRKFAEIHFSKPGRTPNSFKHKLSRLVEHTTCQPVLVFILRGEF